MIFAAFLAGAVAAAAVSPLAPDAASEAAAIEWIKATAHGFPSESPSESDLSPLVVALAGAQIVGIGEVTHGDHEDQAFKAELIKALVREGKIQVLLLEANRQVGVDLDAYVTGRGGDLPTLLRSPSFVRVWRTDEFAGLILWLRAYNIQARSPIRIVGIDVQDAGTDADVALSFLADRDRSAADRLRAAFGRDLLPGPGSRRFSVWQASVTKAGYDTVMQASIELEHRFVSHQADWSASPDFAEAADAARTARQALNAFEFENGRGDAAATTADYYARRDRFMAINAIDHLHARTAAFWAHDLHVLADIPVSEAWPADYTWVGRELRRKLGNGYKTVDFAWSEGSFRAQTISSSDSDEIVHRKPLVPQNLPNNRPGDLGGVLERTGLERFWIDLRSPPCQPSMLKFLSKSYNRGWPGWGVDPKKWNTDPNDRAPLRPGTDILVWFRHITPSHLLPGDDF